MKKLLICCLFILSTVYAEEVDLFQAGKSFVPKMTEEKLEKAKNSRGKYKSSVIKKLKIKEIFIKQNDTLIFHNKDTVVHNVFGRDFNFTQEVGSINKKTFKEKGTRVIRCAIHPKMKIKVHVK